MPKRRSLAMDIGSSRFDFGARTYIMGVLNVTPDSFSDGGRFFDKREAVRQAVRLASDGADIIDVGGESTRPGAADVGLEEELRRVIPVIEGIIKKTDIPVSIDTRKSKVAEEAVKAGAVMVNDVSGLRHDRNMASVVARYRAALVVMHMKGDPSNMQVAPRYGDIIKEIIDSLRGSLDIAKRAGVDKGKIIVDPGIGFGKTALHNLKIINGLDKFRALGCPVCIGVSRKSFIGKILKQDDAGERMPGTIASCVAAAMKGAGILRVHDVKEVRRAALVADAILREKVN